MRQVDGKARTVSAGKEKWTVWQKNLQICWLVAWDYKEEEIFKSWSIQHPCTEPLLWAYYCSEHQDDTEASSEVTREANHSQEQGNPSGEVTWSGICTEEKELATEPLNWWFTKSSKWTRLHFFCSYLIFGFFFPTRRKIHICQPLEKSSF